MKLLRENVENFEVKIIQESNALGVKDIFITGVFMQADTKNRNGRTYPQHVLDKEIDRYIIEKVNTGRAIGELDHPSSGPQINLDRVSHKIVSFEKHGKDFIGKAKLLDTPMGKIAKSLISEGVALGVSSRAMGKVDAKGVVSENFFLVTPADIVSDPSCYDAMVEAVLEGKEWVLTQDGNWVEKFIDNAAKQIRNASKADIQETSVKIFEDYLKNVAQNFKM